MPQTDKRYNKINNALIGIILVTLIVFLGTNYIRSRAELRGELIIQAITSENSAQPGTEAEQPGTTVNINTADKTELMQLSGIGEKRAEDIIEYRLFYGDFTSAEEVMNVNGIGEKIFEKIKNNITV